MELISGFLDLSVIIAIFTAILIYFGKIIADTKVERFEKTDILISGLFFTIVFVLFPFALNLFFYKKEWIVNIAPEAIILFHLSILAIYTRYNSFKSLKMFELEKEYTKRFDKKINQINNMKTIESHLIPQKFISSKQTLDIFDKIFKFFENVNVLLIISISIFYSIFVISTGNVLIVISIAILSFVNLSMIALVHGTSTTYYPRSKITLIDGNIIEGKTIKFGDFVYIINKTKKYFINKNQIKIIEQNIMKSKE